MVSKAWWDDGQEGRLQQLAETGFREQTEKWDDRINSLGTTTQAKTDSLGIRLEDQAQDIREGLSGTKPSNTPSVEEKARRAWSKALDGLPDDLSDFERKVAVQEVRETLEEQFHMTKDMVESITGKP